MCRKIITISLAARCHFMGWKFFFKSEKPVIEWSLMKKNGESKPEMTKRL
jgi:hypothetical protein